jgi:glycine/D-amino acid oxidase-like deaminating enzyme
MESVVDVQYYGEFLVVSGHLGRPGRHLRCTFHNVTALLSHRYQERCLWQAQVDPPPASSSPLPSTADVVVMGAGLCGLTAADTVARNGRSVLVLDKEPLGWGSSSRNGGMVIPELKAGPATLERKYGPLGPRLHREVNEAFDFVEAMLCGSDGLGGIECDWSKPGQLYLAHSERHVEELQALADELAAAGDPAHFVDRAGLAEEIGSEEFSAGVVMERTGAVHPAKLHAGLAARAIAAGAEVHDRTAVIRLERLSSTLRVHTTRGVVDAGQVIVATNAAVDEAVPWLQERVLPVGSFVIATEVLPAEQARSVSPRGRMMVDTKNLLFYWRLTPDGRMAFGGRRSLDPVEVAEARDFLYESLLRIHPQLAGVAVEFAWGGNVAMTLDRLPHVGLVEGAWFATGCNGSGVGLNTWLGHRLGQVVTGVASPPAFTELAFRPIPLRAWRSAYLPLVSRWFTWQDRR